jgi:two-component system cell cycle sensor histidine kinase/response regulator CckA
MTNSTCHILVVDDEPPLLKMVSVYLGRLGYIVTTASSPQKGWDAYHAGPEKFAVAVLDATMAGMTLDELASKMMAANPRLRVIIASGYMVDLTVLHTAAPGRVMFLHKPFTPEMLADAVRRMVATQEEAV